jgi:hypothetical protein
MDGQNGQFIIKFFGSALLQSTFTVGISFPKNLIEKIDSDRGDVSRSKFIVRALEKAYGLSEDGGC